MGFRYAVRLFISFTLSSSPVAAFEISSSPEQVPVIELYTSEGCSSCPPADQWLSRLKEEPGLWRDFVPLAFHVDYWDYIGWKDRFAQPAWTDRQRDLAQGAQMYTPEFFVNGKEWRERDRSLLKASSKKVGVLVVKSSDMETFELAFTPSTNEKEWILNFAQLGSNLESAVDSGENRGRKLRHNFVVRSIESVKVKTGQDRVARGKIKQPRLAPLKGEAISIAVWVTKPGSKIAVQAVGGHLLAKDVRSLK